jgi:hypothetical protein
MNNEPVAWLIQTKTAHQFTFKEPTIIPLDAGVIPLYTHPVKKLTDEEMLEIVADKYEKGHGRYIDTDLFFIEFARAILRKAQEK